MFRNLFVAIILIFSFAAFTMDPSEQRLRDLDTETLMSKERNHFLVPSAAALLDPSQPHGLNLSAVDLRYDTLFNKGYFSEMGNNKEDISVDIRNLRQIQTVFVPKLCEVEPYLKYLRVDYPQIIQNKLTRMNNSVTYAELEQAYQDLKTSVAKADNYFTKLTQMNVHGMECSREETKAKILKVLGRKNFPITGVTSAQLNLVPSLENTK